MRAVRLALLVGFAASCDGGGATDDDKPFTDEAPTDDDTVDPTDETDGADDTDVLDTDDTGLLVDTDDTALPPIDTAETDVDTDPQIADIQILRAGIYGLGSLLRFEGLVVTGRRFRTSPAVSNAISVQDPQYTTDAAMLVDLKDLGDADIPDIGDVVTLVGRYRVDPTGGGRTTGQSVLEVDPNDPTSLVSVTGTASLPAPVSLNPGVFTVVATIEPYEMMRVRVAPVGGLSVTTRVNGVAEFKVMGTSGTAMIVEDFFWDVRDAHPTVDIGASFTGLSGIVHFEGGQTYELAPTGPSDAVGYVAP